MNNSDVYKSVVERYVKPYVLDTVKYESKIKNIEKLNKLIKEYGVYNNYQDKIQIRRSYIESILTEQEFEVYSSELIYNNGNEYSVEVETFKLDIQLNKEGKLPNLELDYMLDRLQEDTGLYSSIIENIRKDIINVYCKIKDNLNKLMTEEVLQLFDNLEVYELPNFGSKEYLDSFLKGFNKDGEYKTSEEILYKIKERFLKDTLNSFKRDGRFIQSLVHSNSDKYSLLADNREDSFMVIKVDYDNEKVEYKYIKQGIEEEGKLSIYEVLGHPFLSKLNIDRDLNEALNSVSVVDLVIKDIWEI